MADRAAAIIISKRHILLMHRIRSERNYYTFPGGNIEKGESAEAACVREVLEETGLATTWIEPAFTYTNGDRLEHFFFIQVQQGNMSLGGPEMRKQSEENRYHLEWIPMVQVGTIPLRPEAVRDAITEVTVANGPIREAQDLAQYSDHLRTILGI